MVKKKEQKPSGFASNILWHKNCMQISKAMFGFGAMIHKSKFSTGVSY